jgi:hypothetical protein
MDHTKDIMDVVRFFQYAFIIVFALALGEAFKQFVAEKATQPREKVVDWGRLPALLSFVVLIFPFYQGMSRYFFATYADVSTLPKPYSLYLMFDGVAFLAESALFFVMSRALSEDRWRSYYGAVLVLLVVDSIWGAVSWYSHGGPTTVWIILNLSFAVVLLLILLLTPRQRSWVGAMAGLIAVSIRTMLDYALTWQLYFPPPP